MGCAFRRSRSRRKANSSRLNSARRKGAQEGNLFAPFLCLPVRGSRRGGFGTPQSFRPGRRRPRRRGQRQLEPATATATATATTFCGYRGIRGNTVRISLGKCCWATRRLRRDGSCQLGFAPRRVLRSIQFANCTKRRSRSAPAAQAARDLRARRGPSLAATRHACASWASGHSRKMARAEKQKLPKPRVG